MMKSLFFQLWMTSSSTTTTPPFVFKSFYEPKTFAMKTHFYHPSSHRVQQTKIWQNTSCLEVLVREQQYWRIDIFGNSIVYDFPTQKFQPGISLSLEPRDYITACAFDEMSNFGFYFTFGNAFGLFDQKHCLVFPDFINSQYLFAKKAKSYRWNDGPIFVVSLFHKGGFLCHKYFYTKELSSAKLLQSSMIPIPFEDVVDFLILSYKHLLTISGNNECIVYNVEIQPPKKIAEFQVNSKYSILDYKDKKLYGFYKGRWFHLPIASLLS